jgi:hypothetical protein
MHAACITVHRGCIAHASMHPPGVNAPTATLGAVHRAFMTISGYAIIVGAVAVAIFELLIGFWFLTPVMLGLGWWMWGDVRKEHRAWRIQRRRRRLGL